MSVSRNIRLLAFFNFFNDFKFYSPIAIIFFSAVTQSFAKGMSIFATVQIASALAEVPTGIFSDLIGRRKTVIAGALCGVLFTILYAGGSTYQALLLGAVVEGISRSFFSGNNEGLLYDTLLITGKKEEYQEFLGRTKAPFQLALAVSALIGGLLAVVSYRLVFWLSLLPQLAALFVSFRLVEPPRQLSHIPTNVYLHLKEAFLLFVTNPKLRLLSLAGMIRNGAIESSYQFQSAFFLTLWPLWTLGALKMFGNLAAMVSFFYSGKLIKRFGELFIIIVSSVYSRIAFIVSLLFPGFLSPIVMTSTSLLFGVTMVSQGTLLQREFSQKQRATMASLDSLFGSISTAVMALGLGLVADRLGPAKSLLLIQLVLFIPIILNMVLFRRERKAA